MVLRPMKSENQFYLKGRSAELFLSSSKEEGEVHIGVVGELEPETLANHGISVPVSGFEFDLSPIVSLKD